MHEPSTIGKVGGAEPPARALEGLRVLDFGQYIAGPLLALMLADQGAEVIRIDPPSGPRWGHPANSVLQRGKKSLCLDLKAEADRQIALDLVATADILIENFRPGVMQRLGLDDPACRALNPRLIYVSMPGFAPDHPQAARPGWEGIVSAAAGLMTPYPSTRTDVPGAGVLPAVSAAPIASNFAAFIGANAVMAALIAREREGVGQFIESSLFAAAFAAFIVEGQVGPPPTQNSFHPAADNRFRCADGRWVQLLMIAPRHLKWFVRRFLPALAREGLDEIERIWAQPAEGRRLVAAMSDLFATRTAAEWETVVNAEGVPLAICQTIDAFLWRDPQARAAGAVIELVDPQLGPSAKLGYPVALSRTPPRAAGPRRALDADRAAVLSALPRRTAPAATLPTGPCLAPLSGIRVVDMSQVLAAPLGARILADFGAEVIKINPPLGWLIGHLHFNSGKQTVLMDVGAPAGRKAMEKMIIDADVLIHNLRSKTARRLGLDEAAVRQLSPQIVYGRVTPYGDTGPKADYRGWEPVGQATSGFHLRQGQDGRPQPARFPLCDFGTGHLFAFALLLGLWVKRRTGCGQKVQSSLMQAGAYHQATVMFGAEGQPRSEGARPLLKGEGPLTRPYQAQDAWLYLHAADPLELEHVEGLEDAGGAADLDLFLEQRFLGQTVDRWLERLVCAGVSASRIETVETAMNSPYALGRGLSVVRSHPGVGEVRTVGPVAVLAGTPTPPPFPVAPPGGDTRAVLTALLGADETEAMIKSGVAAESLPGDVLVVW